MKRTGQQKVKQAAQRSLERALKEERLGLAVIAKAFIQECPDPGRLLTRLEIMGRQVQGDPRVTMAVRQAVLDGIALVRTAIAREIGRPQQLLDPHVGHISPAAVDRVTEREAQGAQMGLAANGDGLEDVTAAHDEQLRVLHAVHEALVVVLRAGPATDEEVLRRYRQLQGAPFQTEKALLERRKELTTSGRVCDSGSRHRGQPVWQLVEQQLLNT